jgi:hypothetical protein
MFGGSWVIGLHKERLRLHDESRTTYCGLHFPWIVVEDCADCAGESRTRRQRKRGIRCCPRAIQARRLARKLCITHSEYVYTLRCSVVVMQRKNRSVSRQGFRSRAYFWATSQRCRGAHARLAEGLRRVSDCMVLCTDHASES